MIQNPAGARQDDARDEILREIRDALGSRVPSSPTVPVTDSSGETNLIISLGSPWYIGTKMRFVALSNGGALEVQDSGGVWHEQVRWTES